MEIVAYLILSAVLVGGALAALIYAISTRTSDGKPSWSIIQKNAAWVLVVASVIAAPFVVIAIAVVVKGG